MGAFCSHYLYLDALVEAFLSKSEGKEGRWKKEVWFEKGSGKYFSGHF